VSFQTILKEVKWKRCWFFLCRSEGED